MKPRQKLSLAVRTRQWAKDSPAWAISIGLHLVAFLAASLFYLHQAFVEAPPDGIRIDGIAAKQDLIADIDRPPPDKKKDGETDEKESDATADEAALDDALGDDSQDVGAADGGVFGVVGVAGDGDGPAIARVGSGSSRRARRAAPKRHPVVKVDDGVQSALRWLARHQEPSGAWSVTAFAARCGRFGAEGSCSPNAFSGNDQYQVGVTALSLLAFLGANRLPSDREPVTVSASLEGVGTVASHDAVSGVTFGQVVKRALWFLLRAQSESGSIGPEVDRAVYNHSLATLALCEAYGATGLPYLRDAAERALAFTVASRNSGAGWRYTPRSGETDASVTGWALLALRSAAAFGIPVDAKIRDETSRWFESATTQVTVDGRLLRDGQPGERRSLLLTGYLGSADAGKLVAVPGLNDRYFYQPSTTATRVLHEVLEGGEFSPEIPLQGKAALATVAAFPPVAWTASDNATWRGVDFYAWFHGTFALSLAVDRADPLWKLWSEAVRVGLVETQGREKRSCREGSWEPIDRWACEGGRVYATAMSALTLEIHLGYPNLMTRRKGLPPLRIEVRS